MIARTTLLALGASLAVGAAHAADTAASQAADAPAVMAEGAGATTPTPTPDNGVAADRNQLDPAREDSGYYANPPENDADQQDRSERTHGLDDTARDTDDAPQSGGSTRP
ncbi:hypothetical protein C84B14_13909 [Salinisphaera sp. C84B14]|uniref:hypothetical protein n=1 Tax=Salinisphaera sp. C84B14 TaxID=1304155 RepID=UPI003340077F